MKKNFIILLSGIAFFIPLYGYAEEIPTKLATSTITITAEEGTFSTTTASTTPVRTFTLCSQEAIEARDTKIASSRLIYNTAMANALTDRKNKEKAAVAIVDESAKKSAIKTSVESYKNHTKGAQTLLVQARKIAWQTFENDVKECREIKSEENLVSQETYLIDSTSEQTPMMRKAEKSVEKGEEKETKTIKETLKSQFENFKSLFN